MFPTPGRKPFLLATFTHEQELTNVPFTDSDVNQPSIDSHTKFPFGIRVFFRQIDVRGQPISHDSKAARKATIEGRQFGTPLLIITDAEDRFLLTAPLDAVMCLLPLESSLEQGNALNRP